MENVDAGILNVGELLRGNKYKLSYFQREYDWEAKHVNDLIDDLVREFKLNERNSSNINDSSETKKSQVYFLGPIIVSEKNGALNLIDGQQRITSLLLILIWIACELKESPSEQEKILSILRTEENGAFVYAIDMEERSSIMNSLCESASLNTSGLSTSIQNIDKRFQDIDKNLYGQELFNNKKIEFANWLIEHVYIAEIKTTSDQDGYKIFASSNDRGLRLSPTDMLKSYLISNVESDREKDHLNVLWKNRINEIKNKGENEAEAIKCWLRAQYAGNRKDFDDIGSEFHRWLQDKVSHDDIILKLKESKDFYNFVDINFDFYTKWYLKLISIAKTYDEKHEAIFCNQESRFTMQFMLILAAISPSDEDEVIWKKINVVATYIDIFIACHFWAGKTIAQRETKYKIFDIVDKIRNKPLLEITNYLYQELLGLFDGQMFKPDSDLRLPTNKTIIRLFLARFSAWLDRETKINSASLPAYLETGKEGYDIEHIIPNGEYSKDDFTDDVDFSSARNSFGALLLLPASFNRSLKDLKYEDIDKLPYKTKKDLYLSHGSLLAKTLHGGCFEYQSKLRRIRDELGIPFENHDTFVRDDITKRRNVYYRLALKIWHPDRLHKAMKGENSLRPNYDHS